MSNEVRSTELAITDKFTSNKRASGIIVLLNTKDWIKYLEFYYLST